MAYGKSVKRRIVMVLMAAALLYPLAAIEVSTPVRAGAPLTWQRDLNKALRQAGASRKFVVVDVYTDWCHWCHKLDRETFSNPHVSNYLSSYFICVRVNGDDANLGRYVTSTYAVRGYPTVLVLEPSGKLKGKIRGFKTADRFASELAAIVGR